MGTVVHRAETRGFVDHGWLQAWHSFSFGSFYKPGRMNFGVLRVLNDDTIAGGKGFGMHPHENMEIITIPLEGALEHRDNMGNTVVIHEGDVQVMSAGKGVYHSEFNPDQNRATKLFQIWLFPNKKDVEPRYDQISIRDVAQENNFYQILSPNKNDQGVWIYQDAWFHLGSFNEGTEASYKLRKKGNGIYIFMISGQIEFADNLLNERDGAGIVDMEEITLRFRADSRLLMMEVPV